MCAKRPPVLANEGDDPTSALERGPSDQIEQLIAQYIASAYTADRSVMDPDWPLIPRDNLSDIATMSADNISAVPAHRSSRLQPRLEANRRAERVFATRA